MLDLSYITIFIFRLSLTLYIVSHAFNVQENPHLYLSALNNYINNHGLHQFSELASLYNMQIYAHIEVIIGCCTFFGWRISKVLLISAYTINSSLLSIHKQYDMAIIGIKLLVIILIVLVPIKIQKIKIKTKID